MKMDAERTKRRERAIKKSMGTSQPQPSRTRSANWTHHHDSSLLSLLKQEYNSGGFINNQFTRPAWTRIVDSFNAKTGLSFNREHLRNRLKVLRNVFRAYNELEEMDGWSWDSEESLVKPADPAMWDRVISINPQYAKCREKPYPEYPILKLFFTRDIITNQAQMDALAIELTEKDYTSSSSLKLPPKNIRNYQNTPPLQTTPNNQNTPPLQTTPIYQNTPLPNNGYEDRDEDSTHSGSEMASEKSENIKKALDELSEISRRQNEIIQYLMAQEVSFGPKTCTTEQCIAKLKTVKNLSPETFLGACEAFRDTHERRVFMSLDGRNLNAWIQRKVTQPVFGQNSCFRGGSNGLNEVDFA